MIKKNPSILKAMLFAPLVVPVAISISIILEALSRSGISSIREVPSVLLGTSMVAILISYLVMFVIGGPYIFWLRSKGWLNWRSVCAGAAVIGAIVWAGYWQLGLRPPPLANSALVGASVGLLVGVSFCLVACIPLSWKND